MKTVFSRRELRHRIERAQELLKGAEMDCLLLTSDENFHYFTGAAGLTHGRSNTRPNVIIVPREQEPIAIAAVSHTYLIKLAGAVKDVRTYGSPFGLPIDVLAQALRDSGLKEKRIGVEMGLEQRLNMPLKDYFALKTNLPNVEFVDAAGIIWSLRMVKSREEVELIRRSCKVTGHARQKTFREIHVGMTERDIGRIFSRNLIEAGADRVSFAVVSAGIPSNPTYIYLERRVKKGDVLFLDGGGYIHTYTCDYDRLAVAGKPSAEQKRIHTTIRKANKKMAEFLKPGRRCKEVFMVGEKALKDEGFATRAIGRMGHGQGILVTEPPSIHPSDETVLQPGIVISTEPGVPPSAQGEWVWEDLHIITEDGAEQLTDESEELYELP